MNIKEKEISSKFVKVCYLFDNMMYRLGKAIL